MAKLLITGASGFVGTALVAALEARGDRVVRLVRRSVEDPARERRWDPAGAGLDPASASGFDAVVHLAGENVAGGRWTAKRKARIRESRVAGTEALATALARAEEPPRALVSASAIGIYGDRGEEILDEGSELGDGFLAEVGRAWEEAASPARAAGIRVVHPRIGLVLGPGGGALKKMLTPFRLGLGGPFGDGRAWWSWIALDDLIAAILFMIDDEDLRGPVNAVSPAPVRNADFARVLGRVLHRPAVLPAPRFALRLLMGREMADSVLLASQRVLPRRLQDAGFTFRAPDLAAALAAMLAR